MFGLICILDYCCELMCLAIFPSIVTYARRYGYDKLIAGSVEIMNFAKNRVRTS